MKIVSTRHWSRPLELARPYRIANRTISSVKIHFVCLETESGLFGYGAATPGEGVTGEYLADCQTALNRHLDPCLKGAEMARFPALTRRLQETLRATPAALAAVDMALYDLAGKIVDTPLVEILGRRHQSLPTSITLGIQPVDPTLAEAREYIRRGFTVLKVKIGESLEEDIALLRRLREEVGSQVKIRVDANQGYSLAELKAFFERTRNLGLELIEQPLKASRLEQMRGLPRDLRLKCAGDESLRDSADALECSHPPHPFGIFNIKLMKCGGITAALEMARTAHLAGIDLMWGCNDESCVSIAAALHTALACSATRYLDLDGSFDLGRDLFAGGFELVKGRLQTRNAPGLGATPLS